MWDLSKLNWIEKELLNKYSENIKKAKILRNLYNEITDSRGFYNEGMRDGTKILIDNCYSDKKKLNRILREKYFTKKLPLEY